MCALEEFVVRGPNELHNVAIDTYIEERRKNPEIKDMGDDSPIMKRARDHAVRRFSTQAEEDLSLMVLFFATLFLFNIYVSFLLLCIMAGSRFSRRWCLSLAFARRAAIVLNGRCDHPRG